MEIASLPPKKRRVALYARVSTADQKNGLDAQIRALRIFCEQNKIEDYELFADENQSGTKASRPGLDRMMKAVENDEVETVVVFAFSRYARSVSHMLKGLETMRSHKTNFVSLTEKLDLNTSLGHVVFVIISAIAQLERDLIAERVRNGLAAAKARGKKIGRERKRNSALIESLLEAQLSYREIARIARCSHGSVHAQKKEWLARKAEAEKMRREELEKVPAVFQVPDGAPAETSALEGGSAAPEEVLAGPATPPISTT
ncbi:MAG: recombinase family protein [Bdellovibrionaceae bacterium]|nr:recombinase family protein [Pseudobdellovibrionaceae bacterium]